MNIRELIPAGEWADVRPLNRPVGMMANHNWAIFAKAKWLRQGGRPGFIKFIVLASSHAGPDTQMVTGDQRLNAVEARLHQLQELADSIPLVPLFDVRLTAKGLMIAMEEVEPLRSVIERGEAYDLSLQVLKDLDPEADDRPRWLHFDICPMNIGVTSSGQCVFIDVESFYLADQGHFSVSVPAWKTFRAPKTLIDEVGQELGQQQGKVMQVTGMRKQRFEIALAAAECVLGPLLSKQFLDEPQLKSWLASSDSNDPAVAFWTRELTKMVSVDDIRPIRDIASDLEAALRTPPDETPRPRGAPLQQPIEEKPVIGESEKLPPSMPAPSDEPLVSRWSTDWMYLKPAAFALRAGRLGPAEVLEYREALERFALEHPSQRDVWEELLLIAISYVKNPALALGYVNRALENLPNDADFLRMKNIVQFWNLERQR
jgi:hypothetical protein